MKPLVIFCGGCNTEVTPRRTTGAEIYPHLHRLHEKTMWKCDVCGNYVSAHHNTGLPLGSIPIPTVRAARIRLHYAVDYFWRIENSRSRKEVYSELSKLLDREFHIATVNSLEEEQQVFNTLHTSTFFSSDVYRRGQQLHRLFSLFHSHAVWKDLVFLANLRTIPACAAFGR